MGRGRQGDLQTFSPWDKAPRGQSGRTKDSPSFKFDKIFLADETNADVHDETGSKVIDYVMKGYNGCIFAYGQTSAGKTHTVHGSEYDPGILPRGLEMIRLLRASWRPCWLSRVLM